MPQDREDHRQEDEQGGERGDESVRVLDRDARVSQVRDDGVVAQGPIRAREPGLHAADGAAEDDRPVGSDRREDGDDLEEMWAIDLHGSPRSAETVFLDKASLRLRAEEARPDREDREVEGKSDCAEDADGLDDEYLEQREAKGNRRPDR